MLTLILTFLSHDISRLVRLQIDLDLSIPFLSIPLDAKPGSMRPLLNINAKALTIAGIFTAVSTILSPLFVNKSPAGPYYSKL